MPPAPPCFCGWSGSPFPTRVPFRWGRWGSEKRGLLKNLIRKNNKVQLESAPDFHCTLLFFNWLKFFDGGSGVMSFSQATASLDKGKSPGLPLFFSTRCFDIYKLLYILSRSAWDKVMRGIFSRCHSKGLPSSFDMEFLEKCVFSDDIASKQEAMSDLCYKNIKVICIRIFYMYKIFIIYVDA